MWCRIAKHVKVQMKERKTADLHDTKEWKERTMKVVREYVSSFNSGIIKDQTSESNRFKFKNEKTKEILSRYKYNKSVENKVSGRTESCKKIFHQNKSLMHNVQWCKLKKILNKVMIKQKVMMVISCIVASSTKRIYR